MHRKKNFYTRDVNSVLSQNIAKIFMFSLFIKKFKYLIVSLKKKKKLIFVPEFLKLKTKIDVKLGIIEALQMLNKKLFCSTTSDLLCALQLQVMD